jgi:hypothetical protein
MTEISFYTIAYLINYCSLDDFTQKPIQKQLDRKDNTPNNPVLSLSLSQCPHLGLKDEQKISRGERGQVGIEIL